MRAGERAREREGVVVPFGGWVCCFLSFLFYFLLINFVFIFRERETETERECGEGQRESQVVSTEPDAGLELTNCEIMA